MRRIEILSAEIREQIVSEAFALLKSPGMRVGHEEARALLEEAGADVLLVECVPSALGAEIAANARVPVIGIGAGPDVDGQILVVDDMLGFFTAFKPKFVKRYADLGPLAEAAISEYSADVRARSFPTDDQTYR